MKREKIYEVFSKIPTMETERLILRPMRMFDAFDMYDYARIPETSAYLTWNPHPDLEYTKNYLAFVISKYKSGEFYDWAVTLKGKEGRMIGTCGFSRIDVSNNIGEVGYVISPAFQGNGYATEAVNEVVSFGFTRLNFHRIEAKYIVENVASRAVMERCGMHFEGISRGSMLVKGNYRDIGMCAILQDEWKREIK